MSEDFEDGLPEDFEADDEFEEGGLDELNPENWDDDDDDLEALELSDFAHDDDFSNMYPAEDGDYWTNCEPDWY